MFGKKYVFESKITRLQRILTSAAFLLFFGSALLISFIVYIPIYAKMQKGRAAGAFFQKSPDAIAVFTGDKGRINYAIDFLKKNPSSKLFISGVYAANSFQTLIENQTDPVTGKEVQGSGLQVDLDYESTNTFENVRETVEYLKLNPGVDKVLIISSDYHIMRVKLIISHYMKGRKPEFFFDSVPNSYRSWNDIKKLLKESAKIFRTFFMLKVLREDVVNEED
jgi:uncharacterized SAM-binding protein YcdF (DUF218 family)